MINKMNVITEAKYANAIILNSEAFFVIISKTLLINSAFARRIYNIILC